MGVATTMAIIGGVASAAQAVKGAQQASAAKDALNDLKLPEWQNPYENAQVSTLGADYSRELSQGTAASNIEALQGAGVRGLVGGVGRVQSEQQKVDQQIAADLDRQQKELDQQKAQAYMQIKGVEEQRYRGDVSALSSQVNQGNQMMWTGISGVAQAGMAAVSANTPSATAATTTTPTGGSTGMPASNYSKFAPKFPSMKINPLTGLPE
jgi:hypothetical protein